MAALSVAATSPAYQSPKALSLRPSRPADRSFGHCTILRHIRSSTCRQIVCSTSSAAGSAGSSRSENYESPYEVLGVNPIEGFDAMKAAYKRRRKDAESRGDEAAVARLERAYDKVMMSQLTNRKKGLTFGSFQVSKDIKYADKLPVIPWGPRIFEKLKSSEPDGPVTLNEEGQDEGRGLRMGKRLLRSLSLAFSCIALASLGYTGILNVIEFLGQYIPLFLFNNQELLITLSSAVMLYIMASFYR